MPAFLAPVSYGTGNIAVGDYNGVTVVRNDHADFQNLAGAVTFEVSAPATTTSGSVLPISATDRLVGNHFHSLELELRRVRRPLASHRRGLRVAGVYTAFPLSTNTGEVLCFNQHGLGIGANGIR